MRPEGIDDLLASCSSMKSARAIVYRDAFPWFGKAMLEAGWPKDGGAVKAVWQRAHKEWRDLTHLKPLVTIDAWRNALARSPEPGDILEMKWTDVARIVSAWAMEKRLEREQTVAERVVDGDRITPVQTVTKPKAGGCPPKWEDFYRLAYDVLQEAPETLWKEIAAKYNRRYPLREHIDGRKAGKIFSAYKQREQNHD